NFEFNGEFRFEEDVYRKRKEDHGSKKIMMGETETRKINAIEEIINNLEFDKLISEKLEIINFPDLKDHYTFQFSGFHQNQMREFKNENNGIECLIGEIKERVEYEKIQNIW
ncbi:hypothetical protein ACFL1H_06570, partial [Nanoarchaeota archaeon]